LQQSQPIVVETRAVMHALLLGRASERAKSWLARAHRKSIPPRKLERQEGGFSVGAVFIRSFGVSFLYEIRRYKSIEKCGGQRSTCRREALLEGTDRKFNACRQHQERPIVR
jgi:hypothetical protein